MDNNLLKILIVDDSPLVAPRVRSLLDSLDPAVIIGETINAAEALDIMQEVLPDVVLLDLNLQGKKGGLGLLGEIKSKYPGVVVIIFTNHAEPYYRGICKRLGADYFFDKSTEFELLPDALRELA
jgi:DNA-binding NarL/FixJ family response regulator